MLGGVGIAVQCSLTAVDSEAMLGAASPGDGCNSNLAVRPPGLGRAYVRQFGKLLRCLAIVSGESVLLCPEDIGDVTAVDFLSRANGHPLHGSGKRSV